MLLRRFLRNRDGGVAPMLALAALPLFGFVGAAVDFSRAASVRTSMQAALDSTALMLAQAANVADEALLSANATKIFGANFQSSEVENLAVSVAMASTSSGYGADLTAKGQIKSRVFGISQMEVVARSRAESTRDDLGCVLALNKHKSGAITAQGTASVTLNGCTLYDNSSSPTALVAGGSSQITALSVGVVGGVDSAANITASAGIKTGMYAIADPYADAYFPQFHGCDHQNFKAKDTVTIQPGVYCGGMSINAGAIVTFSPGLYFFDGGSLSLNGGATLTGDGVTLVFTSQNRNDFATATINGNANIDLRPPKTGGTAGIVIFADRRTPEGTTFKFNGGASQYFGGAIYVPTGHVDFSGGAGTSTNCTQLIGNTIKFTGNSNFALNCKNYGTKPISAPILRLTS
jgi:hypothetical protein